MSKSAILRFIKNNMLRLTVIAVVVGAAIISAVGYARRWPGFYSVGRSLLPTGRDQNLAHVGLFLVLGILLLALIPYLRKRPLHFMVLIAALGYGQEVLELSLRTWRLSANDLNDVLLDVVGGGLGYIVFTLVAWLFARLRSIFRKSRKSL
jgi:glycopeptide antibiotics resistance protein